MTIRTKAGLQNQIDTLIDSGGTPRISAEDLRSVLTDFGDSVEFHGLGGVDVRVVWSADRAVTAAELATGNRFTSNSFNVPAHGGFAYLAIWRADASGGAPAGIEFDGQPQRAAFDDDGTALTTTNNVDGEYVVSLVELDGDNIGGDAMELSG